jgi:hypothetical protein
MKIALMFCMGALLGGVFGLLLGAFIGGNLATDTELFGLRGYEGTGILGLVLGLAAGGLGTVLLMRK